MNERPQADIMKNLQPALRVLSGGRPGRLRLAMAGQDAGLPALERYAAVPSLADPRVLLPLDATQAAWRAVLAQHAAGAANPAARLAARALSFAAPGWGSLLLRDRVTVAALRGDLAETPLHRFLADVLGRDDFVTSLRLAPGRPNGKPVAQAVAPDGTVLAYAKFGWEDLTRRLIKREAAVLAELAPRASGLPLKLPPVLHAGAWGDLETLVLAPLSCMGRTPRSPARVPVGACVALAALGPRSVGRLGESPFWRRTAAEAAEVAPALSQHARHATLEACRLVEARWGDAELVFGQSHGDFIPPNISVRRDGAFNVWDWERSAADVPLGVDAMQFILFLELRRSPRRLGEPLLSYARKALTEHGLDPTHAPVLLALSLLRSILWFGEAHAAGRAGEEDGRFTAALEAILASWRGPERTSFPARTAKIPEPA